MTNLLGKLKLYNRKIVLLAAAGLIILCLDVRFLLKLQFQKIKDASPKVVKLKADIDNLSRELVNLQDLQRRQSQLKQEGALKAKKIISEEEMPLLLQRISDLANKNKVSITQIKPSQEVKAKEKKASTGAVKFSPVLITLDLSGGYHNLGNFLSDLENMEEFVAAEEMKITRALSDYVTENVNLVLKAYVKK